MDLDNGDSLTYDTQRGLAAVTEALEHRVAHETDQHVAFVSFRSKKGVVGFASSISEDDVNDRSSTPRDQDTLRKVGRRTKDEEDETKIEKNE